MIYDVAIETLELSCLLDLKGTESGIASRLAPLQLIPPESPNTAVTSGDLALYWVGPTQWILRAPLAEEQRLNSVLQTNDGAGSTSVVEISDMLQFFSLCGPDADKILAVCCPLDTHLRVFPANAATFTEFLGTKALLLRVGNSFQVAVDRSYADFVNDSLHRIVGMPLPVDHAGRAPYELG